MAAGGDTAKSLEDEIRELKEKNSALVQKVQYWKMTAAQREDEKVDLMKELNELRLAMSHYRSSGAALDSVLDTAVQEFGEHSLTRLVEVSSAITRTVEIMKTYIQKKREVESMSPGGKLSLRDSPRERSSSNKVLRVVPMIRGSAIFKPVIRLRPIDATAHAMHRASGASGDDSSSSQGEEESTPTRHVLQVSLGMTQTSSGRWRFPGAVYDNSGIKYQLKHRPEDACIVLSETVDESERHRALQNHVYIPLRRIDAELALDVNVTRRSRETRSRGDTARSPGDAGDAADDSLDSNSLILDVELTDGEESAEEGEMGAGDNARDGEVEGEEDYNAMRGMEPLPEEAEDENWSPQVMLSRQLPAERGSRENPLEGPSWLLDRRRRITSSPVLPPPIDSRLEADSTTDAALPPEPGGVVDGPGAAAAAPTAPAPPPPLPLHQVQMQESPPTAHTPTRRARRRRSRLSSPRVSLALIDPPWPEPAADSGRVSTRRRDKDPTKVLVLVSKMRLEEVRRGAEVAAGTVGSGATPRRRSRAPLEAPSPNGATQDAGPIVMDSPHDRSAEESILGHIAAHTVRPESSGRLQRANDEGGGTSVRGAGQQSSSGLRSRRESITGGELSPVSGAGFERQASVGEAPPGGSRVARDGSEGSERARSSEESEGEAEGGRAKRRRRGQISYKEKPLNRKLRR